MAAPIEVRVDDEVLARLPTLAITALVFSGLKMAPSRKIETVRDKVIAAARERINEARDARRIPTLAAFHRAFPEVLRGGPKRAWLDESFRAIARRDPFSVVNDAVDAGRLLALSFAVPVSTIDLSKVYSPLLLRMAPSGTRVKSPAGDVDASDLPLLTDSAGPAASPFLDVMRAMPNRQTTDLLVVVYDPCVPAPLDGAALRERASNWLATLTGARLVGG